MNYYEKRDLTQNAMLGFLVGFGIRRAFDHYNQKKLVKMYQKTAIMPKRKSMGLTFLFTLLFGGFGMFYATPRLAIFFSFMEFVLFFIFIGVLNLFFLRPVVLLLSFIGILSYNKMVEQLEGAVRRYSA